MEAGLLMLEAIGMIVVLLWAARGRGDRGLLAWRAPTARPDSRRAKPGR